MTRHTDGSALPYQEGQQGRAPPSGAYFFFFFVAFFFFTDSPPSPRILSAC